MLLGHSYQRIDSHPDDTRKTWCFTCSVGLVLIATAMIGFIAGFYFSSDADVMLMLEQTRLRWDMRDAHMVMHISDTHIDPYFNPTMSMQPGVCHPCNMSNSVFNEKTWCPKPTSLEESPSYNKFLTKSEFAFGRYGCNPPTRLWYSLHKQMKILDPNPRVVIFTGDISPHGFPDDMYALTDQTKVEDLCETKFLVTKYMIRYLKTAFPKTKWAYTMGNNDHLPKDRYWQPYIEKYGDMLFEEGFLTPDQHAQFVQYGSNYIDVDGVRYLSINFQLFMENGEVTFTSSASADGETQTAASKYPVRDRVVKWVADVLGDAESSNLPVYIVGHQPLATKNGVDEFDVEGLHYRLLKSVLTQYAHVIKIGLFGHRNLAGIAEVLSSSFLPLFPSITAPGVSPRGKNQPSFHVLYKHPHTGVVLDFEQWYFDLLKENHAAQITDGGYLGSWHRHKGPLMSWRAFSGSKELTEATLYKFLHDVAHDQDMFFSLEKWKKAGYIGDETPASYECKAFFDKQEQMMTCLFPNQDPRCWSTGWLS